MSAFGWDRAIINSGRDGRRPAHKTRLCLQLPILTAIASDVVHRVPLADFPSYALR